MNIYGFLIGIAIYIGISQFQKKNNYVPKSKQDKFIYTLIILSIIGARIYHVADFWFYYKNNPIEIINLPAGGLGIFGAIILSFIYISIFCYQNKLKIIKILNLITPSLALGQSIGRLGNYFNTEVFGIPTYIDFGQYIPVEFRPLAYLNYSYFHPIWLYESIWMFITYLFIKKNKYPTINYLISYGLIRFFVEFLRFDTWQQGNIKIGQLISLIMIATGFILTYLQFKKQKCPD